MSLSRFNLFSSFKIPKRSYYVVANKEEYTSAPNYPPIQDLSKEGKKKQKINDLINEIKSLKTVEEKMIKYNMPRYYGFKTTNISSQQFSYNSLPLIQYITNTVMIENLPELYSKYKEESASITQNIKSQVLDVLQFEHEYKRWKYDHMKHDYSRLELDNLFAKTIIQQINRIIVTNLASEKSHLLNSQVDMDQKIESFWIVGGMDKTKEHKKAFKKHPLYKQDVDKPVDRYFSYKDVISLILRSENLLPIFANPEEINLENFEIPKFTYDPRVNSYLVKRNHLTCVPGFWPGNSNEFSFLSFNTCGHLKMRNPDYGERDLVETLHSQAIITAFGYLTAQCFNQGFSALNDITYPLTKQTVITDGRLWSLYAYQMNSISLFGNNIEENPNKKNICWGVDQLPLFENFVDGKITGFNEKTLEKLVSLYLIPTQKRLGIELRPNLGLEEKYLANITHEERRNWLDKLYKRLVLKRNLENLPDTYHWEKIYKIDNKTRAIEPRRRPFELFINPFAKRLDDVPPVYIPKEKRNKNEPHRKYEHTYFP